ncbi:hypothetical protein LUZ62_015004 [Rhynchospora pubera]|nr:hypothetical protein LUZ62_015004 [Rhynchospora pubera]
MESAHTSETDFMSNLPEDLLLHIIRLSSMKARAAVQTCTISKRWKHLWEFLPDLNFDLKEFNSGYSKQDNQKFSCFVTKMLEHRKTDILDKFRLSCVNLCKEQYGSSINKWTKYAIKHNVRILELVVCICSVGTVLTDNVFACASIEELHLHLSDCCRFGGTGKINLPRLRKLQLHGQSLSNSDFIANLISGCPLLEELWLESFDISSESTICSQKLQHLTLKNCRWVYDLTINAPNLVSFCFFGSIHDLRWIVKQCGSISSLTISGVSLHAGCYDFFSLKNILINLSCLENLEICVSKKIPPRSESHSYYGIINNLKKLSICGHSFDHFPFIWKYLPNLEKLTFWASCQHSHEHYPENKKWDDMLQRAVIEFKRLKVVEVVFATFDDHKRKLVDDLRRLRDVEIATSNRKLLTFQRRRVEEKL